MVWKKIEWWFAEFCSESQVDRYLELFPELKGRLSKFAIGIFLWNMVGEIDIHNIEDIKKVRNILKVLAQSPAFDFFDESFNECSPEEVCETIGISPKAAKEEGDILTYCG